MKLLTALFVLCFSLSALSWVPQTQDEKNRIGKLVADGKIEEIRKLLKSGMNPNWHYEGGDPLIITAASTGGQGFDQNGILRPMKKVNQEILQLLIDNGADVNREGTNYWSYLPLGDCGTKEACKILIDNGADLMRKTQRGYTAFSLIVNRFTGNDEERKLQILDYVLQYTGHDPFEGGQCSVLDHLDNYEWDRVMPILEKYHNFNWEECDIFQ